jgi:signal transduction histidine kinase
VSTPRRRGGIAGWFRRFVPQRVRTRLTLLYAALFLAGGTILLGLSFALVSSSLPAQAPNVRPAPNFLSQCKQEATVKQQTTTGSQGKSSLKPGPTGLTQACVRAFQEGAQQAATNQRDRTLSNLYTYSIAGLLGLALVSAGLGWVVSGRVLRPVRRITETAQRASEDHLGERLHLDGPHDELRELADTFDAMLDRLDLAFASQRQFVANASHELRTPLTVMRTAIDVTLAKPTRSPEQLESMAERVRHSIEQAERTVEALLTLAASNQELHDIEPVDLATAVEDAMDEMETAAGELGLRVECDLHPGRTTGDRVLLERMVANLVQNAIRHNLPQGWVRLRTGSDNGHVFMEIANSGPVIPDDVVPQLCESFRRATGRLGRDGVGVGLSIVRSVAAAHHGTLTLVGLPAGGLEVAVRLPAARVDPVSS